MVREFIVDSLLLCFLNFLSFSYTFDQFRKVPVNHGTYAMNTVKALGYFFVFSFSLCGSRKDQTATEIEDVARQPPALNLRCIIIF